SRAMTWGVPSALAGGLLGAFIIWFIALFGRIAFRKDAMGHGDIKMARGIGAMLFPAMTMASLACAVVLGTVMGVGVLIYRNILIVKGRIPADEPEGEDDEPYVPETIPSLFKCGLGYALCFDVIGLFVPKFYENYFGENPYSVEEVQDEDEDVPITMIPFGPALALGALCAMLFEDQIVALWASYIARFN
ncbi:MAG: A24 family peptidase, partial [Armatimonadetes bacterium]|nr:A24 family peptidase [Armatimonadota bacterium]